MKAAFRSQYGTADVLNIEELEIPVPKQNEVLVSVYAATVNRTDCHILWGKPLIMRLFTGFTKPRLRTTGTDFCGEVKAIGEHVQGFKVGDRVMGFDGFGCSSHAQYLTFRENKGIALMPANLHFDEAAACIEGAFYAQEAINYLHPNANHTALIIGATGAIGSATVQYLSTRGTNVTAVCRGQHIELVRSIGASRVIDYEKENFINDKESYDFIIDAVGMYRFGQCKHLLKKKGVFTSSGGNINHILLAIITPMLGGKKVLFRAPRKIKKNLDVIRGLIEEGKFKPVIDRKYPLEKIREAFDYVSTGKKVGNVILTIGN